MGRFDALAKARRKDEPSLSYTEAVDEVVANGCETPGCRPPSRTARRERKTPPMVKAV